MWAYGPFTPSDYGHLGNLSSRTFRPSSLKPFLLLPGGRGTSTMAEELPGSNPQHAKGDEADEEDMEVETGPVEDQPDGAENPAVNGGGGSKRGREKGAADAAAEGLEEGAVSKKPKVENRSFEEERMEKVEGKGEGGADMEEGGDDDEEFEGDKARSFDEERMEKLDGTGEGVGDLEGGDGDDTEGFVGDKARSVEEERMEKVEGKGEGAEDLEGGGDDEKEFKGEEEGGGDLEGGGDVEKETSGVSVGPKVFTSSVEMFEYFFKLLHTWPPNLDLNKYEHMVLHDLLKKGHPEPTKKIGVGIQAFQVRYHPAWKSRCFFVVRDDEIVDDFSFRKCVDNILPLPDNMKARLSSSGGNKVTDHKKAWSNQKGGRGSRRCGGKGGGGRGRGGKGGEFRK
ncbi:hypothetical protein MUK42_15497 [Musa troglodytarum]|uniref:EMB514 n=1 Tax=Musa troglodytarum TaxID=320322 RepID=A0A9E7H7S5_9LILI|nr:hypothetical protein MUK42_15497 [Musa troglodytarum]